MHNFYIFHTKTRFLKDINPNFCFFSLLCFLTKVPSRKPKLGSIPSTVAAPPSPLSRSRCPSSTKLATPCKACGRPDMPERFHSHPVTTSSPCLKPIITNREQSGKLLLFLSLQYSSIFVTTIYL